MANGKSRVVREGASFTNGPVNAARATAAIAVVAEHVRGLFLEDWAQVPHDAVAAAFYFATGLGSQAVMLFFVLSGFWVGGSVIRSTRKQTFTWSTYLIQRGVRLWIALIPAVLLSMVAAVIVLHAFPQSGVAASSARYASIVLPHLNDATDPIVITQNVFFVQGILGPVIPTNGALWSLASEWWYYILFPLILGLFWGPVTRRVASGLLMVGAAALVGPVVLVLFPVWASGAAVALLAQSKRPMQVLSSTPYRVVSGVVLLGALLLTEAGNVPGIAGDYLVGAASTLGLIGFARTRSPTQRRRTLGNILSRYADSSYSLYVTHLPIALVAAAVISPVGVARQPLTFASFAAFLGSMAVLIAAGWAFSLCTERHTDRLRRRVSSTWQRATWLLLGWLRRPRPLE